MVKEENRFYNYIYLDPTKPIDYKIKGLDIILKYEPFYVGKGTGKRWKDHLYGHSGRYMKLKMNKFKRNNIKVITLKLNNNITDIEANENEKYLIKIIGRKNTNKGPLCNLNDGGSEGFGRVVSSETKLKMSLVKKGKKFTDKHMKNISLSKLGKPAKNKGLKMSDEQKLKLSIAHLGKSSRGKGFTLSDDHKNKLKASKVKYLKAIDQFDLEGNYIQTFKSIEEVFNKTGISRVNRVCLGKRKTAGGFIWKYKI